MANVIQPGVDGPLRLEGEIEVYAADGTLVGKFAEVWLCRCGRSGNKPFCDGSHNAAQFRDPVDIPSGYQPKVLEATEPGSVLKCTLRTNGPIRCLGPMQVHDPSGKAAWTGTQATFCRCGHSKMRPFCDGTHREIRFEAG
jgi:CDGSH-type Zn-finger protein